MTNREIETCIDLLSKTTNLHKDLLEKLGNEIEKLQVQMGDIEANAKLALWKLKKMEERYGSR